MTSLWPLPEEAHVPGQTPRPATSPVFEAAAAAPARTDPERWQENRTYLYGIALYEAGFFWEAHEAWEPVWMHAPPNSRARALMQGLIQLANGCLKLRMGRPGAADRLLLLAEQHLSEAGADPLMGLDATALRAEIDAFRRAPEATASGRPSLDLKQEL